MSHSYLGDCEAGRKSVSLDSVKKIADGFGISLSELHEGLE